jgi:hypothetical protein
VVARFNTAPEESLNFRTRHREHDQIVVEGTDFVAVPSRQGTGAQVRPDAAAVHQGQIGAAVAAHQIRDPVASRTGARVVPRALDRSKRLADHGAHDRIALAHQSFTDRVHSGHAIRSRGFLQEIDKTRGDSLQ